MPTTRPTSPQTPYRFTAEEVATFWRETPPVPAEVTARGPDAVTDWLTIQTMRRLNAEKQAKQAAE